MTKLSAHLFVAGVLILFGTIISVARNASTSTAAKTSAPTPWAVLQEGGGGDPTFTPSTTPTPTPTNTPTPTSTLTPTGANTTFYVSTNGNDSNTGSSSSPWRTITHAVGQVPDNDSVIIVKEGVYNECVSISRRFASSLLIQAEHPYRVRWQCDASLPILKIGKGKNITIQGFEFTRPDLSANQEWFVIIWKGGSTWAENITLRNNIFHDSVNNDLLRIGTGARNVIVEDNMFYNQAGPDEHIDINGATDTTIQDNIFFNDFAGSGRVDPRNTSSYIVIKDSEGTSDGVEGAQRISVRRNVFLNWEGSQRSFVMVGEDGISTFEAFDVTIENNLMLGNSPDLMQSPITIRGSKNITVRANTIVGDLPSWYYVIAAYITDGNKLNENLRIHNNIWSDPTGTMGQDFSCCNPSQTRSYTFDNNLFFNAGQAFPGSSNPFVRITNDVHRVIGDPKLSNQRGGIAVPRWNGTGFNGGYGTIRQAFEGLVNQYGAPGIGSAAINTADPTNMPADDILGINRSDIDAEPDIGAVEASGFDLEVEPTFHHIEPGESASYILTVDSSVITEPVSISTGSVPQDIMLYLAPTTVPVPGAATITLTSTHTGSLLMPGVFARVPIIATGSGFTRMTAIYLLVGGISHYLPLILKD